MKELILKPQFVDRGGNTVYNIHRFRGSRPIGQIRMSVGDTDPTASIEWVKDAAAIPTRKHNEPKQEEEV